MKAFRRIYAAFKIIKSYLFKAQELETNRKHWLFARKAGIDYVYLSCNL